MKVNYAISDNGMLPIVYINDEWLTIVSLTYTWHTLTDQASSGSHICIVDGYLHGETVLRRFVFDIQNNCAMEVDPETDGGHILMKVEVRPYKEESTTK